MSHQDSGGYADVEAFDETPHRNPHRVVDGAPELGANPVVLIPQDDGHALEPREIRGHELSLRVAADERVSPLAQGDHGVTRCWVSDHVDPLIAPLGDYTRCQEFFFTRDHVDVLNAEGVTAANDRRAVVRVVRRIHQERYRIDAVAQHGKQTFPARIGDHGLERRDQPLGGPAPGRCQGKARVISGLEYFGTVSAHGI